MILPLLKEHLDKFDKEFSKEFCVLREEGDCDVIYDPTDIEGIKKFWHSALEEAYNAGYEVGHTDGENCAESDHSFPNEDDHNCKCKQAAQDNNLERLIEKCGHECHKREKPEDWCMFCIVNHQEVPTPTEAVQNLIKALDN